MVSVYPRLQKPSVKPTQPENLAQAQTLDTNLSSNGDDRTFLEPERSRRANQQITSAYHLERRTFL